MRILPARLARPGRIAGLLLAFAAACAAIDLTTFRTDYAHHELTTWYLRAGAGSYLESDSVLRQSRSLSALGRVTWETETRSDDVDWSMTMPLSLGVGSSASRVETDPVSLQSGSGVGLTFGPEMDLFGYQPGTDLFLRFGLNGEVDLDFDRYESGNRYDYRRFEAEGDVGLGYGRIRDAWPLLKAHHIARTLADERVLGRGLENDDLRQLAAFLSRSWKLYFAHQRPARHLYDSLSALLVRSGATRGPLHARAIVRLDEELYVGTFKRLFGWRVSAGAQYSGLLLFRRQVEDDSTWADTRDTLTFEPYALLECARPIGLAWVFEGKLRYVPKWRTSDPPHVQHGASLSIGARYQLLDRLELALVPTLEAQHVTWDLPRYRENQLLLDTKTGLECSWYLAEHLRFIGELAWNGRLVRTTGPHANSSGKEHWSLKLAFHWGRLPENWESYYR